MRPVAFILAVCASLWLVAVGCATRLPNSSAAPPLLPANGGAPMLTDEHVTAARSLYIRKCTSCHNYYSPTKYTEVEWNFWMHKMSRKAKLKLYDEELLHNYLSLFRR